MIDTSADADFFFFTYPYNILFYTDSNRLLQFCKFFELSPLRVENALILSRV